MTKKDWIKIIIVILKIIFGGVETGEAVKKASKMFNVSEKSIWEHGGF